MKFTNTDKKSVLRFINIGDSVTKNLTIYEYGDDIIAVDFGIGFPEGDSFGVDFIVPDMTYLLENSHKVKALFISHAHADHFAAVPYLLQQFNVPIYANKLSQEFIKLQFKEKQFKNLKDSTKFHLFNGATEPVQLGAFRVSAFNVNHSVPGSLGLAIETPEGTILHMADYKIDQAPVVDPVIDLQKIEEWGNKGVLCLASDSLGSKTEGFVGTESSLNNTFPDIFNKYSHQQLFITTISSNISRMYQIIDAAIKAGRKVVPVGRSIDQSIKVATNLGYLPFSQDSYLDDRKASDVPQDSVVYLIAGCFGQPGSSLSRVSLGEHNNVSLQEGGIVIFSSEPNPPGVDVLVEKVISDVILRGGEVIDHRDRDDLHVSGHGHKEDLLKVARLAKPKYFIPIGGSVNHIHSYGKMVQQNLGVKKYQIFEMLEGDVVEFFGGDARKGNRLEVTDLLIDGKSLSPVVVKDRELLSTDGVFVVIVPVSSETRKIIGSVDVVTRGFIYVKESKVLMGKSKDLVNKVLDKNGDEIRDWGKLKHKIERDLQKYLYKQTGRNPLVMAHSIFI